MILSRGTNISSLWDADAEQPLVIFTNCNLIRSKEVLHDCKLAIKGSKIIDVALSSASESESKPTAIKYEPQLVKFVVDCGGAYISPGFIDWQINGAVGVDFSKNDGGQSLTEGVQTVAHVLAAHGVTSFCPTVVTSTKETYSSNLPSYKPIRGGKHGASSLRLHLEGPVLSEAKRGAHRLSLLRLPDSLDNLYGSGIDFKSSVGIITIAAELDGACEMTARIKKIDPSMVVSIGHSNATFSQAEALASAGATAVTHLFNCLSSLNNRDPGVIGLLGSHIPSIYFGLIADGLHVHAGSLQMAQKCAGDNVTLVTDAISSAGLPDGEHTVADQAITITDGRAVVTATGVLVGSTVFLDQCVREHMATTKSTLAVSTYAASTAPSRLLGLAESKGVLIEGADADLCILTASGQVLVTVVQGDIAFCSPDLW